MKVQTVMLMTATLILAHLTLLSILVGNSSHPEQVRNPSRHKRCVARRVERGKQEAGSALGGHGVAEEAKVNVVVLVPGDKVDLLAEQFCDLFSAANVSLEFIYTDDTRAACVPNALYITNVFSDAWSTEVVRECAKLHPRFGYMKLGERPVEPWLVEHAVFTLYGYHRSDIDSLPGSERALWFPLGPKEGFAADASLDAERPFTCAFIGNDAYHRQAILPLLKRRNCLVVSKSREFNAATGFPVREIPRHLAASKVCPAPAGTSAETFRVYEALESHCVPIVDDTEVDIAYAADKKKRRISHVWIPLRKYLSQLKANLGLEPLTEAQRKAVMALDDESPLPTVQGLHWSSQGAGLLDYLVDERNRAELEAKRRGLFVLWRYIKRRVRLKIRGALWELAKGGGERE